MDWKEMSVFSQLCGKVIFAAMFIWCVWALEENTKTSMGSGCPEGTIYCFQTERCINLDGSCLAPPTCGDDEILQWNPDGFEECVSIENNSREELHNCPEGQVFCLETNQCVGLDGSCHKEECQQPDQAWCSATSTCETAENCKDGGPHNTTDATVQAGHFIVRIPLKLDGKDFYSLVAPVANSLLAPVTNSLLAPVANTAFSYMIAAFSGKIKQQLQTALQAISGISLQNVAIQPHGRDIKGLSVFAELTSTSSVTVNIGSLQQKLEAVQFLDAASNRLQLVPDDTVSILPLLDFDTIPMHSKIQRVSLSLGALHKPKGIFIDKCDAKTKLFALPQPVVGNTDFQFVLADIVPQEMAVGMPASVTVDCSSNQGVIITGGTNIPVTKIITVRHNLMNSRLISCQVTAKELAGDTKYMIGFLALPQPVTNLASAATITVNDRSHIEVDEDSPCIDLPSDLFTVDIQGDQLLEIADTWAAQMTSNGEMWYSKVPVIKLFEGIIWQYVVARAAFFSTLRASITLDPATALSSDNMRVARLLYKGEPLASTTATEILTSKQGFQLCVREQYSGTFNLHINVLASGKETGQKLTVPINVVAANDAPESSGIDVSQGIAEFVYPAVTASSAQTVSVPVFPVRQVARVLFKDVDGTELGLAVIGAVKTSTVTIDGLWEYTRDGRTWETISYITEPNTEIFTSNVALLRPDNYVRFTPNERGKSETWSISAAPRLALLAWDLSNNDAVSKSDSVTLGQCYLLKTGIGKYCKKTGSSAYSKDLLILPLARFGCDNILNSGMRQLACGCGDERSCRDCHNVTNGGAVRDECGVCGGNNKVFNCSVPVCKQYRTNYCEEKKEQEQIIESLCLTGFHINKDYPGCGPLCLKDGQTVDIDKCGVKCGRNACVDCVGVVNGTSLINPCGVCKQPASLNEGCESIGRIVPRISYALKEMNVSVNIVQSLVKKNPPVLTCQLENRDTSLVGFQVPSVTRATYVPATASSGPVITVLVQASTSQGALPSTGQFAIKCNIDGSVVSTRDNQQYLTRFDHPVVTTVSPSTSLINELSEITVTGSGFIDTSIVTCIIRCADISSKCNEYKAVNGTRVSDTKVTCPVGELKAFQRGQIYNISVVLDDIRRVNLTRLTASNQVKFSVRLPGPVAVKAVRDKQGCKVIVIQFDTPVTGASSESCANYFTTASINDAQARCILPAGSSKMFINYTKDIVEGAVLTFKDGVIKTVYERNTQNVVYLSGSVTVVADDNAAHGKPVVSIPSRTPMLVGCTPVVMRPNIENKGCWDVQIAWTVTAEGSGLTGQAHVDSLQAAITGKQQFQVKSSELLSSVKYTYTMTWTAGPYSGSASKNLTKDPSSTASVKVYGVFDGLDTLKNNDVSADVRLCKTDDANVGIVWTLDPPVHQLPPKFRIQIERETLKPGSTYMLNYTVTYGAGDTLSGSLSFNTKQLPLNARISYMGDNSAQPKEHRVDDDMTLTCTNPADTSGDKSQYECTWRCMENLLGGDESEMMPCIDYDDTTMTFTPRELTGTSITLPGATRRTPGKFNLKQTWILSMRQGNQEASARRTFTFKPVPITLTAPEIHLRSPKTVSVSDDDSVVSIATLCKQTTSYSWSSSAEDTSGYLPLDFENYIIKGSTSQDIQLSSTVYKYCGLVLDLTGASMVSNQSYALTLHAYNTQGNVYLTNSVQIVIQHIPAPVAGTVKVMYADTVITALTTKLSISMSGWWDAKDGTDLKCFYFCHNQQDPNNIKTTQINALPNRLEQALSMFTLPQGTFRIEAQCCNSYKKCASAFADGTFTVQAIDSTSVMSVIDNVLPQLVTTDVDSLLSLLRGIIKTLQTVTIDAAQAQRAEGVIKESIKQGIKQTLEASSDQTSKISALEQTTSIAKQSPENIDPVSKEDMQKNARDIAKEATGQAVGSRKKRSATVSAPTGLTQSDAVTILATFDVTVTEETLVRDDAIRFKDTLDDIMLGMCQAYTGSTPWVAPAELSYVRVQRTSLTGYASAGTDVSCTSCSEVSHPAKVNYGSELEAMFDGSWNCTVYVACSDVCVASAQLNIDTVTLTATMETVAPTRKSDIIILKMINPETYAVESLTGLTQAIKATLTLNGPVDMATYDYKCLMWISEDWSDTTCSANTPTLDSGTSMYTTTCTCNSLGIIGVFQQLKSDDITTNMLTTPSASTASTASPAPSKNIDRNTDYLDMTFTLTNDYDSVVTSATAFIYSVKQQLSTQSGYSIDSFKNMQIKRGSIIVSFEVHAAGSGSTLGQMAYKLETMFQTGTVTLTSPGGVSLTIQTSSFGYVEIDLDKHPLSDSNLLPYIIGGALGGLAIIAVMVIVILLILKKNKKQRTHPNPTAGNQVLSIYDSPPPTYGIVPPPPPYMYEDPPLINKWVENELKKVPPGGNSRPGSTGSHKSGSSFEQRIQKKASSNGPAPVGD